MQNDDWYDDDYDDDHDDRYDDDNNDLNLDDDHSITHIHTYDITSTLLKGPVRFGSTTTQSFTALIRPPIAELIWVTH